MNNLIFDLGFYDGSDTRNYIQKGYNVIAVEASPTMAANGEVIFSDEIKNGKLILLNRIFSEFNNIELPFYIHPENKEWSTADKSKADYWGIEYETTKIKAINYFDLIDFLDYPNIYYIKCDIEGFDYLLIEQIIQAELKPQYLSFELSRLDYYKIFSYLYVAGYTEFQLRNQANNLQYSSGAFGEFLPVDEWINFDECLTRYMKYKELKAIDNKNLALGWIDIHARR